MKCLSRHQTTKTVILKKMETNKMNFTTAPTNCREKVSRCNAGRGTLGRSLTVSTLRRWAEWPGLSKWPQGTEKSNSKERLPRERIWELQRTPSRFSWILIRQSDQSLSRVHLFETPWIAACQASLSITNSQSSLRLTSTESVMPSSHLILCRPLLPLPPIPPSIRVFSNESTLRMRWPKT